MSNDCIFCKIAAKEIPASTVYEDDRVIAFRDVSPQAPEHILVIPKKHLQSIMAVTDDTELIGHMVGEVVPQIARELNLEEKGFRLVTNIGEDGGQTVNHLHLHILGGRSLTWPPG